MADSQSLPLLLLRGLATHGSAQTDAAPSFFSAVSAVTMPQTSVLIPQTSAPSTQESIIVTANRGLVYAGGQPGRWSLAASIRFDSLRTSTHTLSVARYIGFDVRGRSQ